MAKSVSSELESFSHVVEAIYDCALDPSLWQETVRLIADLIESQTCILGVHNSTTGRNELTFKLGYDDEEWWREHEETYSHMSPFWTPLMLAPVGVVKTRAMLVDDGEFLNSRYYLEWVKRGCLDDAITVKVLKTGQRLGLLVANRAKDKSRYGAHEVRLLTLLSPHLCRSVLISDALNLKTLRSELLEATLNAISTGVYLADRRGRVTFLNRAAEHQVIDGRALRIENNHLAPTDRAARTNLLKTIAVAAEGQDNSSSAELTLALPANEKPGLIAAILPLSKGERQNLSGNFAASVAVFVQDPVVVPPFPGEAFSKLYGLSGSELRVLLAMAPGLSVKDAAEVLGIGETTAKTHLQHIYAKTGTSKQTELMRLFMNSAPPIQQA